MPIGPQARATKSFIGCESQLNVHPMLTAYSCFSTFHVNVIDYEPNQCENYQAASDEHIFVVEKLSFLKL
jgi:hypothetical protein